MLSSTEADETIRSYADAISDFLHGMNQCRGIIASRQFRGPGESNWPRFHILPLSETRRRELIEKADLEPRLEQTLVGQLGAAGQDIRLMASNPMLLGLLCEHMRSGHPFPENAHIVFETYVNTRFSRDRERLERRYNLEPAEVRATAELVAFTMSADNGLGLRPTRDSLKQALVNLGFELVTNFDNVLDALEYIKLAQSESVMIPGEPRSFTFAHRRFQEYFATNVVLREPERVKPRQLLTDARWRETAVVMCQTQPLGVLSSLIEEMRYLLVEMLPTVPELIENPLEYVEHAPTPEEQKGKADILPEKFDWPPGALHVLSLLQAGFGSRLEDLPDDIRLHVGRLLISVSETGTLRDRISALEVAGTIPSPVLLWLLRSAFASSSQLLKNVAYQQVARLGEIPSDIGNSIRQAILLLAANGRLRREYYATRAHLNRLTKSSDLLAVVHLLLWLPRVDLILYSVLFVTLLIYTGSIISPTLFQLSSVVLATFISYVSLSLIDMHLRSVVHQRVRYGESRTGASIAYSIRSWLSIYIFVFINVRLIILLLVSLVMHSIYITILYLYTAMWAPMALLSARTGQFKRLPWWPIMPLWPLLYLVAHAKTNVVITLAYLKRRWKILLLVTLILVSYILSFLFAVDNFQQTLTVWIPCIAWVSVVGMLCQLLIAVVPWLQDMLRWQKWTRSQHSSISGDQLLEMLRRYNYDTYRIKFIRDIREQIHLFQRKRLKPYLRNWRSQ